MDFKEAQRLMELKEEALALFHQDCKILTDLEESSDKYQHLLNRFYFLLRLFQIEKGEADYVSLQVSLDSSLGESAW